MRLPHAMAGAAVATQQFLSSGPVAPHLISEIWACSDGGGWATLELRNLQNWHSTYCLHDIIRMAIFIATLRSALSLAAGLTRWEPVISTQDVDAASPLLRPRPPSSYSSSSKSSQWYTVK